MEEHSKVIFCWVRSAGTVCTLYLGASLSGEKSTWWGKWDVPQAIGFVAVDFHDDISVFMTLILYFVNIEALVIIELANRDEGSSFYIVKDVAVSCGVGEFWS